MVRWRSVITVRRVHDYDTVRLRYSRIRNGKVVTVASNAAVTVGQLPYPTDALRVQFSRKLVSEEWVNINGKATEVLTRGLT